MRLRHWKLVSIAGLAIALTIALALLGGGWYYSGQIRDGALKVDRSEDPLDLEVSAIAGDEVTLKLTPDADEDGDWDSAGVWGLEREDGYDQVGPIVSLADETVIREYLPLTGGLETGDMVRLDSFAFPRDPMQAHGIGFEEVSYSSPLGDFPAWLVERSSDTWAIFVHGRGANRREALRMLPLVVELDMTSLIITYRNDEGAPENPDGYHWFGLTEWEDLEGAVKFAIDRGADGVVLVGYSMGGGIVTSFLYRSELADEVRAVILDAPFLGFGAVVDHAASQRRIPVLGLPLPGLLTETAKVITSIRFGLDFDELDYLSRVGELSPPILLFTATGTRPSPLRQATRWPKPAPIWCGMCGPPTQATYARGMPGAPSMKRP